MSDERVKELEQNVREKDQALINVTQRCLLLEQEFEKFKAHQDLRSSRLRRPRRRPGKS
jgi:hypothetical protein